jgi:prolipoprotein diacylglyceryltransferase
MSKFINQLIGFLILLAAVIGGRYYYFVEYEADPYSQIGTGLQSIMPQQVKDWGCARLAERFPGQTSPGC